jgi:Protein of unknwon function (DUF3310)
MTNEELENQGWFIHAGQDCPARPKATVTFRLRDGTENTGPAGLLSWSHLGTNSDIVAWKYVGVDFTKETLPKKSPWDVQFTPDTGFRTARPAGPNDNVNHPKHYTSGGIECIDAIQAQLTPEEFVGFLKGNIAKYGWRSRLKGGIEDHKKQQWYLNKLLSVLSAELSADTKE